MPKTTKTTKKASAASGKKSGLSKKFSLQSRKVQFFVFIAIVAILGGGYFTIKSFAASNVVAYSFSPDNKTLRCENYLCEPHNDAGKNNLSVILLKDRGTVHGTWDTTSTGTNFNKTFNLNLVPGNKYRTCIYAKGIGQLDLDPNPYGKNNPYYIYVEINDSSNYKWYCTGNYDGSLFNSTITSPVSAYYQRPQDKPYTTQWPILIREIKIEIVSFAQGTRTCAAAKNC